MPYVLSPIIELDSPGMWGEGFAYTKKNIHSIKSNSVPPVNYDEHTLKPHSLTHIETPAHIQIGAKTIDDFYSTDLSYFYGKTLLIRLKGNEYILKENGVYHWEVTVSFRQARVTYFIFRSRL